MHTFFISTLTCTCYIYYTNSCTYIAQNDYIRSTTWYSLTSKDLNYSKVLASPCLPSSLIKTLMDLTRVYLATWMVWMGPNLDQLLKNNSWHLLFAYLGLGLTLCGANPMWEKKGLVQSVAIPTQAVYFLCILHSLPLFLVCHLHLLPDTKKQEELRIVSLCHACCAMVSEYTDSSTLWILPIAASEYGTTRLMLENIVGWKHCRCGQKNQPTWQFHWGLFQNWLQMKVGEFPIKNAKAGSETSSCSK